MTPTLTQLLDAGEHHVRHILLQMKETQLTPFYHLISDDKQTVVGCVFDGTASKEAAVAAITELSRQMGAQMVMFVSEAWTVVIPTKDYAKDAKEGAVVIPSQHPDRIEVVILVATDGSTTLQRVLRMARNKRGRLTGLHRENENAIPSGGRMIDGIIAPPVIH